MIRFLRKNSSNTIKAGFAVSTFIQNQYNFFVDFKGLLYFDDSTPFIYPNCIKDVKFITQLYKNLKVNNLGQEDHNKYSHYGQFWGERNFVRSAISPVIFNYLDADKKLNFSLSQKCGFEPEKLSIDEQGRIWHPYKDDIQGVFSNDLMVTLLQNVRYTGDNTVLQFQGNKYLIKRKV